MTYFLLKLFPMMYYCLPVGIEALAGQLFLMPRKFERLHLAGGGGSLAVRIWRAFYAAAPLVR